MLPEPLEPLREGSQNFLLRFFQIWTENGQINTIKTGLKKDLVLGDPLPPLDGQRPYFRAF